MTKSIRDHLRFSSHDHTSLISLVSQLEDSREVKTNKTVDILDELQRSISIRKVEISDICHHEKLPKPDFTDLNWVIEQIYWLKKTL